MYVDSRIVATYNYVFLAYFYHMFLTTYFSVFIINFVKSFCMRLKMLVLIIKLKSVQTSNKNTFELLPVSKIKDMYALNYNE